MRGPRGETIYPAATRHREGLDIYVNRAALALDIADRRADNDREAAVTDTEIRAWLAERWSRSQPKEAALDYVADGVWQDHRENVGEDRIRFPGEAQGEVGDIRAAANDNMLARIARDVRRTAFGWRHARTVAAFADGRRQVLAAYDDLRERTRAEGDAVALGGAYRETLTRHAVLLKQAEAFRARPDEFASLLTERGGIARKDLDAFEDLHARARRHRRAATMRHVHWIKREAETGGTTTEARIAARGAGAGGRPRRSAQARRYGDAGTRPRPATSTPSRRSKPKTPLGTRRDRAGGYAAARPGSTQAGLVCALRSLAAGLERAYRTRPANRRAVILRQGIRGHDPAHPGAGGEPGYPGRDTGRR